MAIISVQSSHPSHLIALCQSMLESKTKFNMKETPYFPMFLLKMATNNIINSEVIRVKHHFIMTPDSFAKYLKPLFVKAGEYKFKEAFLDCSTPEEDNILMSNNLWLKKVSTDNEEYFSLKTTALVSQLIQNDSTSDRYTNPIFYPELKINKDQKEFEIFNVVSDLMYRYEMDIHRTKYVHAKNPNIHLVLDKVTYTGGKGYAFFSIYGDIPSSKMETVMSSIDQTSSDMEVLKHTKPCRSKIIQLLYDLDNENGLPVYHHLSKNDVAYHTMSLHEYDESEHIFYKKHAERVKRLLIERNEKVDEKLRVSDDEIEMEYQDALNGNSELVFVDQFDIECHKVTYDDEDYVK